MINHFSYFCILITLRVKYIKPGMEQVILLNKIATPQPSTTGHGLSLCEFVLFIDSLRALLLRGNPS